MFERLFALHSFVLTYSVVIVHGAGDIRLLFKLLLKFRNVLKHTENRSSLACNQSIKEDIPTALEVFLCFETKRNDINSPRYHPPNARVWRGSIPVSTVLRKSVRIFRIKKNRYVYIFNKSELQVESRQDPKTVPTTASATLKEINHTMYPNITECLRIFSTLPVTTCECERNVSALRLLIRYLRSTI